MSVKEWLSVAGWTAVAFLVGIALDMMFKYRLQLVYAASHEGSRSWTPSPLTRPAVRHIVIFLMACIGVEIYRERVPGLSASVIMWFGLLAVYGVFLFRDSVRDLTQRRTE